LTKTMERVRTGAFVDVPKGTVVVGDRRRAPQAGELVEMSRVRLGLVQATVQTTIFHGGWGQDHGGWRHETYTCPLHRILEITSHLPDLVRHVSKTVLWAASAINCRPAGTAPKQSNQRRASSLSSTCRWPKWPRCPHGYLVSCPEHVPGHSTTSREGTQTRPGDTLSKPSCQTLCYSKASFKLERARSSAPQLSRACSDIKQADCMRWLGENHDSTALGQIS
jgi:hypothetical protein